MHLSHLTSGSKQKLSKTLQETCHLATAKTVGKGLKSRCYRS